MRDNQIITGGGPDNTGKLKIAHNSNKPEPVKITKLILLKAKAVAKWQLVKLFLKKFFDIREYAYAIFTYELICKHKSPKRHEHVVLAKISRNATSEQVKKKLFTLKPVDEECTYKVVEVKLKPIGEIKSV